MKRPAHIFSIIVKLARYEYWCLNTYYIWKVLNTCILHIDFITIFYFYVYFQQDLPPLCVYTFIRQRSRGKIDFNKVDKAAGKFFRAVASRLSPNWKFLEVSFRQKGKPSSYICTGWSLLCAGNGVCIWKLIYLNGGRLLRSLYVVTCRYPRIAISSKKKSRDETIDMTKTDWGNWLLSYTSQVEGSWPKK